MNGAESPLAWRVILVGQTEFWGSGELSKIAGTALLARWEVGPRPEGDIATVLRASAGLQWLASHHDALKALTNLKTLAWVVQAAGERHDRQRSIPHFPSGRKLPAWPLRPQGSVDHSTPIQLRSAMLQSISSAGCGVPRRYTAKRLHEGASSPLPIAWRSNGENPFYPKALKAMTSEIRAVSAVMEWEYGTPMRVLFVDTIASNFRFHDENNNAEMARCVVCLRELAHAIGGLVIGVHHPPKTGIGERGGGALRADIDDPWL